MFPRNRSLIWNSALIPQCLPGIAFNLEQTTKKTPNPTMSSYFSPKSYANLEQTTRKREASLFSPKSYANLEQIPKNTQIQPSLPENAFWYGPDYQKNPNPTISSQNRWLIWNRLAKMATSRHSSLKS